ncbi:MAG: hypothetical protein RJA47_839 [Actinomycetota bacterium]
MRRFPVLVALLALVAPLCAVGAADASSGGSARVSVPVSETGRYIVQLRGSADPASFMSVMGIDDAGAVLYRNVFSGFSAVLGTDQVRALLDDPQVASVEADQIVTLQADQTNGPVSTNIPNSGVLPWGLDQIDQRGGAADGHYVYTADGTGVRVYVLDTGVNAAHADFGARVVDGWSYRTSSTYISNIVSFMNTASAPYGGSCKNVPGYSANIHPTDVDTFDQTVTAGDKGKTDNEGHGTHVAGIVGGSLTGVAKNVTIVPVRILNSCGISTTTVTNAGLDWILSDHTPSQKAIVNMSIGFTGRPASFETKISSLLAEGIPVVAAAGNDPAADPCTTAPAGTPGTISVGAVWHSLTETYYSAHGQCVDIFAPGGTPLVNGSPAGVNSTWHYLSTDSSNTSTYKNESGTSMAAPHVAGAVAQYMQGLTLPADVTTVPGLAWAWLKQNATCDVVTYYDPSRTQQSPNRFLNTGSSAVAPCAPRNVTVSQAAGQSVVAWDEVATGNGSAVTGYQVTTTPSTAGCTTNASTFTCTLTGLADGTTYTVSVKAINGVGAGTAGTKSLIAGVSGTTTTVAPTTTEAPTTTTTTTTVVPDPVTPTTANATTSSTNKLTISWPAVNVSGTVEYTVTISPGGVSCTTRATSCTFAGVKSGTNYSFTITARNVVGSVAGSSYKFSATAGFTVKLQSVKVRSRTLLSRIVTSPSKGKRTYKVTSGRCTISTGRLVAPTKAGTCRFRVSIAKSGSYPAMSTTVKLVIVG